MFGTCEVLWLTEKWAVRELSGQMVCVPDFLSCYCDLKRQRKEQGKAVRSHFFGRLLSHMSLSALFTFRKYRLYITLPFVKLKTSVRVFKFYNTVFLLLLLFLCFFKPISYSWWKPPKTIEYLTFFLKRGTPWKASLPTDSFWLIPWILSFNNNFTINSNCKDVVWPVYLLGTLHWIQS